MKIHNQLYINSRWQDSESSDSFNIINPATMQKITSVASASINDALLAIDAADAAMQKWKDFSVRERAEIL